MRGLLVFLGVAAAAGGLASPTTAVGTRAALRLSDETPVTFTGFGFRADEHVKVVAVSGRRVVHWVTTGAAGRFAVRFPGLNPNACRGLSALAVGDEGSRAGYKRAPGQCPDS